MHDCFLLPIGVGLNPIPVIEGRYATESEVIRDGLRALLARDRAVESWLTNQVDPAYDALKADSSRAVTVESPTTRSAP